MYTVGVLFGAEDTFPWSLIDRINAIGAPDVRAEVVKLDAVRMDAPGTVRVIIDRISHQIPFYRTAMKQAALAGVTVINNPFGRMAGERFFHSASAASLGVTVPRSVLLPHYKHPAGTDERYYRNLQYPLDWDAVFRYVQFPAVLKPQAADGDVVRVENAEAFFAAYHSTGDECMMLEAAMEFTARYRCYVVNRKLMHVMRYDAARAIGEQYAVEDVDAALHGRMLRDALVLCRATGSDFDMLEFGVADGVPNLLKCEDPAPEADYTVIGADSFDWVVQAVAEMAVEKARSGSRQVREYAWDAFLGQPLLVS